MLRKGPTLAKAARMGHPNSKSKPKFKIKTQIQIKAQTQRRSPSSKAKRNFKSKAQLQKLLQERRGLGGLLGGALALVGDFGEFPGFYVVDEAAHGDVLDIGVVPDAGDLAADILLDVLKGVEMRWADS